MPVGWGSTDLHLLFASVRHERGMHRALARLLLVVALLAGLATPAAAHPFGDPQTLDLTGDGSTVTAVWKASPDDLTALALHLKVLKEKRTFVYENGALVPGESDDADAVVLAESEELADYLTERIAVKRAATPCPGRLVRADQLATEGAEVEFSCTGSVTDGPVDVTVTTLTDVHPAYRTLASAGGERVAYSETESTHEWRLGASSGGLSSSTWSAVRLVAIVIVLLALAGVARVVARRRASRR